MITLIDRYGFKAHLAACFVLGAFASFAMPPFNFFPALILGLGFLYIAIDRALNVHRAFWLGFIFAFSYFVAGLFWVGNALLVEGNPYGWAWPLALCGLQSLLAIFIAFGCALGKKFDLKTIPGFLAFTACIGFFEFARGYAFTGFPWNLFGHTWSGIPQMLQVLSFSDMYWLTYLTVVWLSLPAFLLISESSLKIKKLLTLFLTATFVFCISFGYWRLQQSAPAPVEGVNIHIVQSNIQQSEKWKRENLWGHFLKHIDQSRPTGADQQGITYVIWSETALSQWVLDEPNAIKLIQETLSLYKGPAYLLTGLLRYEPQTDRFFNSLVMIDKFGDITNVYDKSHLVPFGEYIPFQKWIPLKPVTKFRGFAGGDGQQTMQTPEGIKYTPAICYEIIFANEVIRRKDKPDFILNVTNDSWYGDTPGPRQHLQQAVYRAIEEGIPVVRVADTGISAIVDARGHIIDKSGLFTEYEKTLALPGKIVVSKPNKAINQGLFLSLLVGLMCLGLFKRKRA